MDFRRGDHFDASATISDGGVAFVLTGELDWEAAAALRPAVLKAAEGMTSATVDLSGVSFIDSTGLSLLIALHKSVKPKPLVVTGATARARRVIQTSGLDKVFDVRDA